MRSEGIVTLVLWSPLRNVRVAATEVHLAAADLTFFGFPLDFDHGSGLLRASWLGCPTGRQGDVRTPVEP